MWREENIGQRGQPQVEVRLATVDVEAGGEKVTGLKRLDQRIFVDERAACRIHEHRAAWQTRESFPRHQSAVAAGQMQRENLATRQKFVEACDVFGALL